MMEVNSRSVLPQTAYRVNENNAAPAKVGDVSSIVIKERNGSNEAKVVLKGQEVTVQFDGPIPAEDRVLIEVAKQSESGQLVVKPIISPQANATTNAAGDVFKKAGFDARIHPELDEALRLILAKGGSVSKDSLVVLQDYLKNDTGSSAEKLDTIKVMLQKNIELTKIQLHAVNTALNGESLTKTLAKFINGPIELKANVPLKTQVRQVRTAVQTEPQLDKAIAIIQDKLLNKPELKEDFKRTIEKSINEANLLVSSGQSGMAKRSDCSGSCQC